MSIRVECEHCFATMQVPEKFAGKFGKCKTCGGRVKVPEPGAAKPAPAYDDWLESAPPPRTAAKKPARRSSSDEDSASPMKRVLAVVGSILLFMVIRTAIRMGARLAAVGADKVADAVAQEEPGGRANQAAAASTVPVRPSRGEPRGEFPEADVEFSAADTGLPETDPEFSDAEMEFPEPTVAHREPDAATRFAPSPHPPGVFAPPVPRSRRSARERDEAGESSAVPAPAVAEAEIPSTPESLPVKRGLTERNLAEVPPGTRKLEPDEQLEVGMRVIAEWAGGWEVGRVVELTGEGRAQIDFVRFGEGIDGYDNEVEYSHIRIQLPRAEIDPKLLVTVKHQLVNLRFNNAALKSLEAELLKCEGYIPNTVKVDRRNRRTLFVALRGSHAQDYAGFAFDDAGINVGRQLSP